MQQLHDDQSWFYDQLLMTNYIQSLVIVVIEPLLLLGLVKLIELFIELFGLFLCFPHGEDVFLPYSCILIGLTTPLQSLEYFSQNLTALSMFDIFLLMYTKYYNRRWANIDNIQEKQNKFVILMVHKFAWNENIIQQFDKTYFYFIPQSMSRKRQKANFFLPSISKNLQFPKEALSSMISDSYHRSNTQPITDILRNYAKNNRSKDQTMLSNKEKDQFGKEEIIQKQEQMASQNRNRDSVGGSHNKSNDSKISKKSIQLMLYRKSIKHLIQAFQEKSKQIKRLNRNCYYSPKHPKQNGNQINFHEDQKYENPCEKRRKSKVVQVKRKLRKGVLKTEASQSTQIHPVNRAQLKRAIKINNPFSQQKLKEVQQHNIRKRAIIAIPLQHEASEKIEANSKRDKSMKIEHRSKRTTIGGWKFDKFETNYLI